MIEIIGANVPEAYSEGIFSLKVDGKEEDSRNGKVLAMPAPALLTIYNPSERVLFDPIRNANPFFHVMEAIWMFAGSQDVRWLEYFNAGYRNYADPETDIINGAYGYRWRNFYDHDQLMVVAELLAKDTNSRRGVIGMWDPNMDLFDHADVPCNTQIMFRIKEAHLDMTVINRSNDFVWGMMGANVVHMTMLHELFCCELGAGTGDYRVFSNNLHIYQGLENYADLMKTIGSVDPYVTGEVEPFPLLTGSERMKDFLVDAEKFISGYYEDLKCAWFHKVAIPMFLSYRQRKEKRGDGMGYAGLIEATDWRLACQQWIARKIESSSI